MLQRESGGRNGNRSDDDDGGVPEREHQPHGDRPLALVDQLSCDVVDGCNMVGVHCVRRPKLYARKAVPTAPDTVKRREGPAPRRH